MKNMMMVMLTCTAAGCLADADKEEPSSTSSTDAVYVGSVDDSLLHRDARSNTELQQQVALQLERFPGGKQISANEIAYEDGAFVMTFSLPDRPAAVLAAPDCPGGWFCFYDHAAFGYPRGKLSDPGWQDLSVFGWSDRTESVHNNTNFRVEFDNHFDAGNPANGHSLDELDIFAANAHSSLSTVSRPNVADHVFRF